MASGDSLMQFDAAGGEPPATNFGRFKRRNGHYVIAFKDAATNEDIIFSGVMPQHYGGGGVTVFLHYTLDTATTGNTDWDVSWERIGDQQQDIDSDGFASVQSVDNTTVPGTAGLVDIVSIAFTNGSQMDGVLVGESFRLKVTRDGASDTAAGDAQLKHVELQET